MTRETDLEFELQESRRMEAMGQLARGASHDFYHILGIFKNYIGFLEADISGLRVDSKVREDLQVLRDVVEQGEEVASRLRTFSRRSGTADQGPVDFSHLLSELEGLMRFPGVEIRQDLGVMPAVLLDPAEAQQVILNLAFNARDAMPDGGILTLRTREVGGAATFSVSDTGIGMDKETLRQIYDPFFTTKTRALGSGLGLSNVYGIVAKAHGKISVKSKEGVGTTFLVILPLDPS